MNKIVSTEMTKGSVLVSVKVPCSSTSSSVDLFYEFPFTVVSPRTALNIATLLVSDATIPSPDEE